MSSKKPTPPNVFARLRPPAALNYLVMTATGLVVYAMIMMSKGNDAGALIAVLLAVPGVLARWTASPVLVILLTILMALDPGFLGVIGYVSGDRWYWQRDTGGFQLEDILLAASLLAYTIGHYRLTAIIHQSMPDDPTVRRDKDPANPPRRPVQLIPQTELPRLLIVAGGCVVAGPAIWLAIYVIDRAGPPGVSEFTPGTSRFLLTVWLAGLTLMIASAALVYMRANRMTRTEAALQLRDEFFQEERRETDRIQRWRKWYKERVALRRRAGK
jgi:hypothetical protein